MLDRIARRDLRAFEALYRAYHGRLSRFILNIIRRAPLVEEVLNDTMMVIWDKPGGYNGSSKLSTWIFAIAYRKALKALKRVDEPLDDEAVRRRPSLDPNAEQEIGQRQSQEILMHAINELSADHRAVVDLAYFHGVGYREIAEIMNCPVDTVKTRMFHARRHLRGKLAGELADWL